MQVTTEAAEYPRSILIFDLDSIAQVRTDLLGIQGSLTESNRPEQMDSDKLRNSTVQYIIHRQDLLSMTLQFIADRADVAASPSSTANSLWLIAMAQHPYVVRRYKEAVLWPKTPAEEAEDKRERELAQEVVCSRCGETFVPAENSDQACYYHLSNEVYCDIYVNQEMQRLNAEGAGGYSNRALNIDYRPKESWMQLADQRNLLHSSLRYRCCSKSVNDRDNGCQLDNHPYP